MPHLNNRHPSYAQNTAKTITTGNGAGDGTPEATCGSCDGTRLSSRGSINITRLRRYLAEESGKPFSPTVHFKITFDIFPSSSRGVPAVRHSDRVDRRGPGPSRRPTEP